jgi:hypothetical protein
LAVRSSPEAAQRSAEGAGLDGIAHGRSTISSVPSSTLNFSTDIRPLIRHASYTAKLHQIDRRYPRLIASTLLV